MKKLLILLCFVVAMGIILTRPYSLCNQPIHYRIDTVDPEFNLSKEVFLSDINQSAQIWNNAEGKELFVYDPKGDLSINLIYDGRQALTNQISQLENNVKSEKQNLNPQIAEYQTLSANFKQQIDKLNTEIEYWNSHGGASPDEYQKIITKQQDLKAQADKLNAMAQSLNISTDTYNSQVNQLNQTISSFNNTLEQRPEEGIFKGSQNRIEIYFNINKNELTHTLAHELGHALGLIHNSNPKAIMYYKTNQGTAIAKEDMTALAEACQERTILELSQNYFKKALTDIRTSVTLKYNVQVNNF